ncbi:DUF6660 family protein [Lacinutrix undariae]
MKFITFILSFYLLALNFMPCSDSVPNNNEFQTEISQHIDLEHEHNNLDFCSPFCQCHCCHVHATYTATNDYEIVAVEISTKLFLHFDSLGKDINNPLFQPPRA